MSKSDSRQIWSSSQVYECLVLEWEVKSMPIQVLSTVIFPLHTPQWIEVIVAGAKYKPWLWMGKKKESTGSSLVLTPESCFSHVFLSKNYICLFKIWHFDHNVSNKEICVCTTKKAKNITYWHLYQRLRLRKCSFCMVETDAVVVHPGAISGSWYKLTNLNLLILTRQNSSFLLQKELT